MHGSMFKPELMHFAAAFLTHHFVLLVYNVEYLFVHGLAGSLLAVRLSIWVN